MRAIITEQAVQIGLFKLDNLPPKGTEIPKVLLQKDL
jgi:hypothetical protein